jgi:hypothetical protein
MCSAAAKKRKKESDLKRPLLASVDGCHEFDSTIGQLRSAANFHPLGQIGRPANAAAEQLCAHHWRTGAVGSVCELKLADVAAATDRFSEHNKLGQGGSCDVFMGDLFGLEVAVKKLSENATALDDKQFASEMKVLRYSVSPHKLASTVLTSSAVQHCPPQQHLPLARLFDRRQLQNYCPGTVHGWCT